MAKTIQALSKALHKKELSASELVTSTLAQMKKHKILNCFISITEEHAKAQALIADKRLKDGSATVLTGIPFALKDMFCTKGILTSCGSKILSNFISPYDATVTEKLQRAGTVLVGKTNMDQFGMGSSNENSFYGPALNPWDTTRVPGGSSGGSASAISAGLVPGSLGTDTGGSIRQPAALCGITGLKPTYGRVSRFGMIAYASSLDQGGPLAQTAFDCALILNEIAGFDERDSTSIDKEVPDYTKDIEKPLTGLKVGLPKEYFSKDLDGNMLDVIMTSANTLKEQGATLVDVSLPNMKLSVPAYYIVAPAECSSNLARFDGVRYGYRCENPKDLADLYSRTRAEGFGDEVKRRILVGTYALSSGYYDAYYLKAQKIRRLIRDDFLNAFKEVDVLLGPTTPTPAFKLGEKTDNPIDMYLADIFTIAVNLAGLPGLSMPSGFIDNLPVGTQLIGQYFDEATLLKVAHRYQCETDWHTKTPEAFS